MARKLFEEQSIRTRRGRLVTDGTVFVVYTDSAGTVPADISATSGGSAISGSAVAVADIAGLGPAAFRFYGPDGVDTLYLRCPSDASLGVQEIEADTDERLDALEAGGGGGAHPDLATHDTLGLATDAELTAHAAAVDPHGGYVLESAHTLATHDTLGLATDAELNASVTSAVSTHAAASDPHGGYVLESDHTAAAHDGLGLATDAELTAHAAASDPHGDRAYADATTQGLDPKASVLVKSTGNLTLSGEQTIDGVLTSASRVLVADQTAAEENGVYVTAAGAWSRATDADVSGEVTTGLYTYVEEGTTQASSGWVLTTPAPITLGVTPLVFSQFSQAGQVFGGAGLVKTGNVLDVSAGPGLTVTADTVGISPGGVSATELAASAVTDAKVDPAAAIGESKLALNFPTHAESHAARHDAAGADPLAGYATSADLGTHESAVDPHQGYVLESAHTLATHDTLGLVTDAILATHDADTTVVHGIADTSKVALELAVADRGLWVSTTGNDSNDGLSGGNAKLTVQAALNAIDSAGGGDVNVLGGIYAQTAELTANTSASKPIRLVGQGAGLSGGATILTWGADLGSGKFGIRPTSSGGNYNYLVIERMRLVGPNNAVAYGSFPADMDGVQLSRRVTIRDSSIRGFRAGVKVTADHNRLERVTTAGNGYGVYFQDMTAFGDHTFYDCDLSSCWISSIAVGPDSGSIQGFTMFRGHLGFCPYSIYLEPGMDPANLALGTSVFLNVSFEAAGNGHIISPDLSANCDDVLLLSCGNFSVLDTFDIDAGTYPAIIQVGRMRRWQFQNTFPTISGNTQPTDAMIKANTFESCLFNQANFRGVIDAALALGTPVQPFQAKIAGSNRWADQSSRGVISKADNDSAITAGQVLSWAPQPSRDYLTPHAVAQAGNADAGVAGVALTAGPAINEGSLQNCVVMISEGRQVRVLTAVATPALNTPLMIDPTDRNKVTTSDGRLDLPYLGFASSQSGTTSGTNCNIDLQIARATGVRRKTITGSRGGNAALAGLLTQLAALGLITDSTTA